MKIFSFLEYRKLNLFIILLKMLCPFNFNALLLIVLCSSISHQTSDLFKAANELVDSASSELIPKDQKILQKIDKDGFMNKAFNLLNKHSIGVLCKEKIQINFSKNFQQLYETFCSQLKKGKSIKEAVGNLGKIAGKKEYAIDTTIFGGIQQKIQNLNFLNAKNKDGMEKFVGHFVSATKSFLEMLKGNKLPFVVANANNKNGRKSRRAKRDDGDLIICIDTSYGNSGSNDSSCCSIMFISIVFMIICLGLALYYYFHLHHHIGIDFIGCAIFAVIFFILTLISGCCVCSGND